MKCSSNATFRMRGCAGAAEDLPEAAAEPFVTVAVMAKPDKVTMWIFSALTRS
jgi:hypothetical protein